MSFKDDIGSPFADSHDTFYQHHNRSNDENLSFDEATKTPHNLQNRRFSNDFGEASSALPTPTLTTFQIPSRPNSLRFNDNLPSRSNSKIGKNNGQNHSNVSPFVIDEDETFQVPKFTNPELQNEVGSSSAGSDDENDNSDDGELNRNETVMKRHRFGTQRNKKGVPKHMNRTKTFKWNKNPSRNGSMRSHATGASSGHHGHGHGPRHRGASHFKNNEEEEEEEESDSEDSKRKQVRTIFYNMPLPADYVDEDGEPILEYPRNKVRTTKYTPLSFVPKNLMLQFKNIANVYFLTLIILGAFDIFGVPSPGLAAVPLIVIVIITAIKDAIEDSRRTILDMEINNTPTTIMEGMHNPNVSDDNISTWRKFKKANSRGVMATVAFLKKNLTKSGRAQKLREKIAKERGEQVEQANVRNSFDSLNSNRNSENPFSDTFQGRTSAEYNNRDSLSYGRLKFRTNYWKSVKVGDLVRINNNDEIPADTVILSTSDADGACYVETKNLDGETNLKVRQAMKFSSRINHTSQFQDFSFRIESEGPHANLYSYQGNLKWSNENEEISGETITINNVLLRGCTLRNTKWAVGIVIFTGSDTKIMLNAGITPSKTSRISRELNWAVLWNFVLLFIICFVSGLVNGIYYDKNNVSRTFFEFGTIASTPALNGLVGFFVAVILYQSLVPISLYISIEIIKTAQAFFIYSDVMMYYPRLDYPCTPKSWNISDDLGQIEYIFSDKTGTLTQNVMEFKKCTINGISYGKAYTEALAGLRKRQGVDVEEESAREKNEIAKDKVKMIDNLKSIAYNDQLFEEDVTFISNEFVNDLKGVKGDYQKSCNEHFMLALSLCHSVLIEASKSNPEKFVFKAQSPDEAALVGTARDVGFVFHKRTKKGVVVKVHGIEKEYQILNILEFNSTRKRMSAIIKVPSNNPDGEPTALLISKGADSIIYERLKKDSDQNLLEVTAKHLETFATEGLRTLCIAQRELTWSQYTEWSRRLEEAASSLVRREERMEECADKIERELVLLGGTAIEDRLQDGVPDAIAILAQAGIKLWVLTGDKVETAINIGFSCNLLGNDMELLILKTSLDDVDKSKLPHLASEDDPKVIVDGLIKSYLSESFGMRGSWEELEEARNNHEPPSPKYGVVIDGDALKLALNGGDIERRFLLLCKQCKAVLCCRVSPAQKASVVKMVKETLGVMTLAIGDGSNDVAMIQAADVGVGIAGEEGRAAVMSSDYAIGQFRFLARLVLVHGRWSYKRLSEMIPSFFFKNVIFTIALFWYGIYNDFDGSYLFEFTYLMFYNLAFTSLPVIFLGILDQDVNAVVSLLVPQLYRTGILRTEWTMTKFWWYMGDAMYQSLISFFWPYCLYYKGFVGANGLVADHRYWMGTLVATISIIACNLHILFHQYTWDWFSSMFVAISILIVFGWTGIWTSSTYSAEFYKAGAQLYGEASFWACMFIGVLVCLLPRFTYDFVKKLFFPADVDIIRECFARGDYNHYPHNYDPTDPNRAKISKYSLDYKDDIEQQSFNGDHSESGESTAVSNSNNLISALKHTSLTGDEINALQNDMRVISDNNRQLRVTSMDNERNINDTLKPEKSPKRKSFLGLFNRNSKGRSLYDNQSIIENYHNSYALSSASLQTEEIQMEDFDRTRRSVQMNQAAETERDVDEQRESNNEAVSRRDFTNPTQNIARTSLEIPELTTAGSLVAHFKK